MKARVTFPVGGENRVCDVAVAPDGATVMGEDGARSCPKIVEDPDNLLAVIDTMRSWMRERNRVHGAFWEHDTVEMVWIEAEQLLDTINHMIAENSQAKASFGDRDGPTPSTTYNGISWVLLDEHDQELTLESDAPKEPAIRPLMPS